MHLFRFHYVMDHSDEQVRGFSILNFFMAIAHAAFAMMLPLVLDDYLNGDKVLIGIYFSVFAIAEMGTGFLISYLFSRFSRIYIFNISILLSIYVILLMNLATSIFPFMFLDVFRLILFITFLTANMYFISEVSTKKKLAKNMSIGSIFGNVGGIIGVFVMGYLASIYGNDSLFLFVPFCLFLVYLYFKHMHLIQKNKHITHKKKTAISLKNVLKSFLDVFKREDLKQIFLLYFFAGFWIAFFINYRPLLISALGYSVDDLGAIVGFSTVAAIFSIYFISKIKNLEQLKSTTIKAFGILSISCLFLFLFYLFAVKTGSSLPFIISMILFLVPLQVIAMIRGVHYNYVLSSSERNKYTAFAMTSFSIAKLILPLIVSFFLSLGFDLYQFFVVMSVMTLFMLVIFYRRPKLHMK